MFNPFEPVVLDRIDVDVRVEYRRDVAEIVGVSLPGQEVHAGDTVPLRVTLRPYAGPEYVETVPVDHPAHGGRRGRSRSRSRSGALVRPDVPQAESLRGYIDNMRKYYGASTIVATLQTPDDGRVAARPPDPGAARVGDGHAAPVQPDQPRRRVRDRRSHRVPGAAARQRQAGAAGPRQVRRSRTSQRRRSASTTRRACVRRAGQAKSPDVPYNSGPGMRPLPILIALLLTASTATRRRHQVLPPDDRQGLRGRGSHREHGAADGRRRAGDEVDADHARRRLRLVRRHLARRQDRLLRHRRQGRIYAVDTSATRRAARALVTTLEAAWVTALAVRPDGTLVAGTTPGGRVYTVDPKNGKSKLLATLTGRARLGAGARRQERHRLRRHRRAGEDRRHRRPAARARTIWDSGDKHVVSLLAADDKHLLRRHLRGGDPVQGRRSTAAPRRSPTSTPRRCARWRASGGSLYAAVNDFERSSAGAALAAPAPPPRRRAPRSPPRRRARRRRRDRCRARASARPRPRSTASTPTGAWSRCSRSRDGYFTTLAFDDERPRLRRHRQRGPRLPHLRRPHRRAGDRRVRAAGAGAAARRQRLPGRHRRRRRRLPRRCPRRRARRPTCRACSTASTGRAGACSAGTARTTSPSRAARATPPSPTRPGPASRRWRSRARPPRAAWARSPARPPATSSTARRSAPPTDGWPP